MQKLQDTGAIPTSNGNCGVMGYRSQLMEGIAQLFLRRNMYPGITELPKVDEYVATEPNYDAINGQTKKKIQKDNQLPKRVTKK